MMSHRGFNFYLLLIGFTLASSLSVMAQEIPAIGIPSQPAQKTATDVTESASGTPVIEFEKEELDFGKAMAGEDIKIEYIFKNTGDSLLKILNVRPQCGCTTAGETSKEVLPGATGSIPIKFKTKGYKGDIKKTIRVTTNAPGKKSITLKIKGKVWEAIEIKPAYASFGQIVDQDKSYEREIKITSHLEEPLEILETQCDSPNFKASLETIASGSEYKLLVETVPPLKQGSNRATINMKTNNEKKSQITVMASCYVVPPVHVRPAKILIPNGPLKYATSRFIFVNHNTASPLKIEDLAINTENVEIKLQELSPGKNYKIVVAFEEGFEYPDDEDIMLKFKTNDPSAPEIQIPVQELNKGRR